MIQNNFLLTQLGLQQRQEQLRKQHLMRQAQYQQHLEAQRRKEIEDLAATSVIKNGVQNVSIPINPEESTPIINSIIEETPDIQEEKPKEQKKDDGLSELRKIVKEYLLVDDDIKERSRTIRELREQQKVRKAFICEFMKNNELEDMSSSNGRLRYRYNERPKALTQKKAIPYIQEYFQGSPEGEKLIEHLLSRRENSSSESLSRLKLRKKDKA